MRVLRVSLVLLAMTVLLISTSFAEEPEKKLPGQSGSVSYYKEIRPIFQAHCQGCHQPAKRGGDYVMTDFAAMLKGGESESAAVVPGKPDESYLIELITPDGDSAEMPKGKKPLSEKEIELITQWIADGAKNDIPMGAVTPYDMDHPPKYLLPPVITSLDFSPDSSLLAVSGYHEVLLHKADGSELVARLVGMSERIESAKFSPDGKFLAVTGGKPGRMGEVQVWDVAKRELTLSLPVTYDTLYGAGWSPDGKLVSFGCSDNTLRAINATTGKQVLFSGAHNDWVLDTTFSVKGTHLVSVSRDRTMKLVMVKTQRFIDNITSITPGALKGGITSVQRHPTKDELLVGSADGIPKTFLMHRTKKRVIGDDYQKIRVYDKMPGRVFAVGYSPKGDRIVAGSSYNGTGEVRVYQTADGKQAWKYATSSVYAVAYRADAKTVAAAGFDGSVRLFDAASGKPLKEFVPVPISEKKEVATAGK